MPEENTNLQDPNNSNTQGQGDPATWEDALKNLPEPVRALYDQHVTGLRNTVQATRQERDDLAKQIRDLSAKVEKGSELERSLNDFSARLEAAERKATFLEDATRPEIGCRNPKAAYALATAEGLFDRRGHPDWEAIKTAAPELFGAPSTQGNAGAGTGNQSSKTTMNDFIRRAAGRA